MDRNVAEEIYGACERALAELSMAEQAINRIDDEDERKQFLRALATTIAEILGTLRGPVVREYPCLEPPPELGEPDTLLDEEEFAAVSRLSENDIQIIDEALLAECAPSWRKVARVVGTAIGSLKGRYEGVPDSYFAQRVMALAARGFLESQGNLQYMRFSEVRLPGDEQNAA